MYIVGISADQNSPDYGGAQPISKILHMEIWIVGGELPLY